MVTIAKASCGCETEPLLAPFGFKGRSITVLWQTAVCLQDDQGNTGCAPGVQSTVWSDPRVMSLYGEEDSNARMYAVTRYAVSLAEGTSFADPLDLFRRLYPRVLDYARQATGLADVRPTFALNAMVPLDLAAWQLYARAGGFSSFDAMLPPDCRPAQAARNRSLAAIPLVTYNVPLPEVQALAESGMPLIKIKIGNDPDRDGDPEKMLAWDMHRISELHALLSRYSTPHTDSGKIAYYLDANGRYDSRERLLRLVDHLDAIGALSQTLLLEEPFPEDREIDVHGLPVRIAADECVHTVEDAVRRIDLGYSAMALKPIAKTLSVSLEVARCAFERGIPCFCADLTVNPLMVDWNKNVAARLQPLPGMRVGVVETNGAQNYTDWSRLCSFHPRPSASWIAPRGGLFTLDEDFYRTSGGILEDSPHYLSLARGGPEA